MCTRVVLSVEFKNDLKNGVFSRLFLSNIVIFEIATCGKIGPGAGHSGEILILRVILELYALFTPRLTLLRLYYIVFQKPENMPGRFCSRALAKNSSQNSTSKNTTSPPNEEFIPKPPTLALTMGSP